MLPPLRYCLPLVTVLAVACSLKISPPLVKVTVQADLAPPTDGVRDTPLDFVQNCLYVAVKNAATTDSLETGVNGCPGEVTGVGSVFGPYTLDQMKEGVSLSIPGAAGTSNFQILGIDAASCSTSSLSAILQRKPREMGWYKVAAGTADLSNATRLSLNNDLTPSTVNQFSSCVLPEVVPNTYRLGVVKAFSGYSESQNSPILQLPYAEGGVPPKNPSGGDMTPISLGTLRSQPISIRGDVYTGYHARVDFLVSLAGHPLTGLSSAVDFFARATFHATSTTLSPSGCDSVSAGSPGYSGVVGFFNPGSSGWLTSTANGFGQADLQYSTLTNTQTVTLDGGQKGLLLSVRPQNYVLPGTCSHLWLDDFYFEISPQQVRRPVQNLQQF